MTQFTSGFDADAFGPPGGMQTAEMAAAAGYDQSAGGAAGYTQYSTGTEQDVGYSANPFMAQDMAGQQQFTAPSY